MKLYDYTNLLNVINEVNLENKKLKNLKEMTLKNKYYELEQKLFNSGILEDWKRLNRLVADRIFYSKWDNSYLDSIYKNTDKFFEYRDNMFTILVSSGSSWSDYLCISPEHSLENRKLDWKITSTTKRWFSGFRNNEEEYKVKILMIETLINTYEDYRDYVLKSIVKRINEKIDNNNSLEQEIISYL